MLLAPGAILGPYRILTPVGGGGMGEVYQATDTRLGRTVAIKVLQGRLAESAAHRERFELEARLISRLNHPNICTLHDVGAEGGTHYLVMEYVDGVTLENRLRRGALPIDEAVGYATQILEALHAAHRQGIVHRDLKPANIMLTRSGVKLLDFGLARLDNQSAPLGDETEPGRITEAGTILGTVQYMAPEQLEGKEADTRTDIFAFGAIAYEMLTGRRAFDGGSRASLIAAILKDAPRRISMLEPTVGPALEGTIQRCLAKNPDDRWQGAGDLLFQLRSDSSAPWSATNPGSTRSDSPVGTGSHRRSRWVVPAAAAAAIAVAIGAVVANVGGKGGDAGRIKARLSELEAAVDNNEWEKAYSLARTMETESPGNPDLEQIERRFSSPFTFTSDPPGARVFRRAYQGADEDWVELGTTPLRNVRLPGGLSRIRVTRDGYEPLVRGVLGPVVLRGAEKEDVVEASFKLDKEGTLPAGTVRVPGWTESIRDKPTKFADFFLSKFEVTNREYKEFVDRKGYERLEFWQQTIVKDGVEIPWQDAMKVFTDQTGLPGPSTWIAGDFPDGHDNYPVAGVSWYEAAAFARFAGRDLPSVYHWRRAFDINGSTQDAAWVLPASNLAGTGPVPVGKLDSLNWSGAYDMAGNVREWTMSAAADRRFNLGGGWSDNRYMGPNLIYAVSPLDRSEINGFRLAVVRDDPATLAAASAPLPAIEPPDWSKVVPVTDETFEAYKSVYAYDALPLNAVSEATKTVRNWTREHVTFDAVYAGVRMGVYLFVPKNSSPPYQTVVYVPGTDAWQTDSVDEFGMPLDWLVKSGRMVVLPVMRGTLERKDGLTTMGGPPGPHMTLADRDAFVKVVQDVRRSVDYLVTRPDVAPNALIYFGISGGVVIAPQILSQEPRFRVAVLDLGGLVAYSMTWRPELRPETFLPRVKIPILAFNGELDATFPLESSAMPFFAMLGTPAADKEQIVVPGGHSLLTPIQARKTIEFLNERVGRVAVSAATER